MTLYHHQDYIRLLPGGAGEIGATIIFKRVADDSAITTATTNSNGFFQKSLAATATTGASSYELHPGPYYTDITLNGYTRHHSSVSIGKAGPLDLAALVQLNRAIGNGLISTPANDLDTGAVTSAGAARTVVVATFAAVIQGIPLWNDAARTLTIAANTSGNPRIDTIVVEMVPAGQATEGKCTLKVVAGTPAASPVAPTLTQTTVLWQLPLANVAVANGASVINQGDITDRRDYVERSVTAVEADLIALEARVDDLDTGPRLELVGYYSNTYDPGSIAANEHVSVTRGVSFTNGYSSISVSDIYLTRHAGVDQVRALVPSVQLETTTTFQYTLFNPYTSALDPANGILTVAIYRLVTV